MVFVGLIMGTISRSTKIIGVKAGMTVDIADKQF